MSQTMVPVQNRPSVRRILASAIAFVMAMSSIALLAPPASAAPDDPPTVVSLTFDDGNVDQLGAVDIMNAHGMPGTFYVNSGSIGMSGFMNRSQLDGLAADGHEIGGHTLNHTDLTTLPTDEARRQICLDRANLISWGFAPRSFAYPFAVMTPAARQQVQECGYNSGRGLGDISSRFGCAGCDYAETLPPPSPYETKALDQVDATWTLQDFKDAVTNAEQSGGGWVQLTFHNFCGTGCGELSVTQSVFTDFLDWLALRQASNNTSVKTVGEVVGGTVKPPVATPPPTPTNDPSGLTNPGFESVNDSNFPMCWQQAGFGVNTATFSTVSPGRTGNRAAQVTVSGYSDGDAKLLPSLDLGTCAPPATPGKSYVLRSWYTSTALTQYAVYRRTTSGGWEYWTSSPYFAASSTYTQATWTTPPLPAGYDGISFGLSLLSNGTLTADDYSISATDAKPVTSAVVSPAAPNGAAGWYTTQPTVTLSVANGSESAAPQYSYDGTNWTNYTAPILVPDGTHTLRYRSRTDDTVVEDARTLALKVDTTNPTVTPTFTKASRAVDATVADATSGPGTIEMREGTGPWAPFTGPVTRGPGAATLEFRATDAAGNVSPIATLAVPAALVTNAAVAPASPDGTGGWYTTRPTVTLSQAGGAPTATWEYAFDDGPWATYTGPIEVPDGSSTLRYRGVDGDEVESAHSIPFKVDTVKPVTTTSFDSGNRTVDATASDATSGLASIEHRIDGGPWETHTTPITVGNDASTIAFRATDAAGNVSDTETVEVPAALITTATFSPVSADGLAGWYVSKPQVTLTKVSGSATAVTEYSLDGGAWTTYTGPFELDDSTQSLRFRTRDGADIEDVQSRDIKVDTTAPGIDPSFAKTTRTISAAASDSGSTIDRIEQRVAGGAWETYTAPWAATDAATSVEFRAYDKAGNVSSIKTLTVPERHVTSTARLALSGSSMTYGKRLGATVTVDVPAGEPAATGTVTLKADGKPIGTGTVVNGTARVAVAGTLAVRRHLITASYSGDATTKPSTSAAAALTITKATPKVTLKLSSSKAKAGKTRIKVKVAVSVPGTSVKPTGRLNVMVDGKTVRKATLTVSRNGKITVTLPKFKSRKNVKNVKISVKFTGSPTLKAVTSKKQTLRVRP